MGPPPISKSIGTEQGIPNLVLNSPSALGHPSSDPAPAESLNANSEKSESLNIDNYFIHYSCLWLPWAPIPFSLDHVLSPSGAPSSGRLPSQLRQLPKPESLLSPPTSSSSSSISLPLLLRLLLLRRHQNLSSSLPAPHPLFLLLAPVTLPAPIFFFDLEGVQK